MKSRLPRFLLILLLFQLLTFGSDLAYSQSTETEQKPAAEITSSTTDSGAQQSASNTEDATQDADIEDSMADIKFIQQTLDSLRQGIETSKATTDQNRSGMQSVRDGLELIDSKLLDAYNRLDDSRSSIATNVESLNNLNEALQTLSRDVRANASELGDQNSLIEDNAVRLFEILIEIGLLDERSSELVSSLRNNSKSAQDQEVELPTDVKINHLWTVFATVVTFMVILAFTLSGRQEKNWLLKDGVSQQQGALPVSLVSAAGFMVIGFGLMYGASASGIIGVSSYLFGVGTSELRLTVPFVDYQLLQNAYIMLAGLIVYTAVNRLLSSIAHFVLAFFVGAVLIPIYGHWVWSGNFIPGNTGWLEKLGFVDQAGSTVIHLIPACFALMIVWKRGHTQTTQNESSTAEDVRIPVYSATSVVFLWISLLVLITGELPISSDRISDVMLNVHLAAASGGAMAFVYHAFFSTDRTDMTGGFGGFICGLVAIAACAETVSAAEAATIGATAGLLQFITLKWIRKYFLTHVSQIRGAYIIAIHGTGGIWGALCVALFGTEDSFAFPNIYQILTQAQGVGVAIVYSVVMAFIAMYFLQFIEKSGKRP